MKDLLKKPVTFEKVEFWIATAIYILFVFTLLGQMANVGEHTIYPPYLFSQHHVPYSFTKYYFIPWLCRYTIFYGSFILLNFFIAKSLINGKRIALNLFFLFCLYGTVSVLFGAADTWIKSYLFYNHTEQQVYNLLFKHAVVFMLWLLLIFTFYTVAKYILLSLKPDLKIPFSGYSQLTKECIVALAFWVFGIFFLAVHTSKPTAVFWSEIILLDICFYWHLNYTLIPKVSAEDGDLSAFLSKTIIILVICGVPVELFNYGMIRRPGESMAISLAVLFSLVIVALISWLLHRYRLNKNKELYGLQTALGKSSANLDFLRSQINPHFLFNALNTLYGTSLQENAERTGEGIQKLGDMMRFMLQENIQDKISLAREVDYLNNYIDLQKLRTQTSPDILILTEIDEQLGGLEIAPMLLIPFVENAFKHGISLRETSHVKISLHTRERELLFDVYNSVHLKPNNDPEKNKSGIGLENVKQRLQLLYPKRHELVVRESATEFFVHLTINL